MKPTLYDDYGIPCSEMRTLPTGGGGNVIVSRQGFEKEMSFRRERIRAGVQFDLPEWASLEVYGQIETGDPIPFVSEAKTNFPHPHPFAIQGWNGHAWEDSKHGAVSPELARKLAEEIGANISMPGTQLRIVKSKP